MAKDTELLTIDLDEMLAALAADFGSKLPSDDAFARWLGAAATRAKLHPEPATDDVKKAVQAEVLARAVAAAAAATNPRRVIALEPVLGSALMVGAGLLLNYLQKERHHREQLGKSDKCKYRNPDGSICGHPIAETKILLGTSNVIKKCSRKPDPHFVQE